MQSNLCLRPNLPCTIWIQLVSVCKEQLGKSYAEKPGAELGQESEEGPNYGRLLLQNPMANCNGDTDEQG